MSKIEELVAAAHGQSVRNGFWDHDAGCLSNQGCYGNVEKNEPGRIESVPCMTAADHEAHGGAPITPPEPCVCVNRDLFMKSALVTSELSEALEEYRLGEKKHGGPFDTVLYDVGVLGRTKHDYPECTTCGKVLEACGCDGLQKVKHRKPVGFLVELADAAIRLFDFAGHFEDGGKVLAVGYQATSHTMQIRTADDETELAKATIGKLLWAANGMSCALGEPGCEDSERLTAASTLLALLEVIAKKYSSDLWQAIEIKMAYNQTRSFKHGKIC